MRYLALACDYDGTLASDGRVDKLTVAALERVRASGRRVILVTGRELDDLLDVFPHLELFDRVVAENGALLYRPASRDELRVHPYGVSLLLAGSSGSGKSTWATGLLERLAEQGYQFCIIDPEGDLGPSSFHFRGPDDRLNLQAQNLMLFNQLAAGLDDATWLHHLRQGDYSRWFRETIKDDGLAAEAARIEKRHDLSPSASRAAIRAAIEGRYTGPA